MKFESFKSLDQKFAWSFLGFVLSMGFFLFGLYTTFIYEKKPRLQFQALSEAPVYSLTEEVGKLDILFDGEDIRKKHETLTLLVVRVMNVGSSDILRGSFDPNHLPSISFTNSRLIKIELAGASSDYLKNAVQFLPTNGIVFIAPVILEADEFFDIKLLLLHNDSVKPCFGVAGKIAGVPRIEALSLYAPKAQQSFWQMCSDN